ncbi:hypothetical protein [Polyangium mundeleinium]|uniref:Uncharacterized protein n=1 Tax=Polyangium mundeleinium TaxID=2995306 RepID=A0ABT5EI69_9BACT|nr:hypothetical protein [Polyangium mundeleinium]MDC0741514.1 hypothetical protein [Polyangium mundeleinium]
MHPLLADPWVASRIDAAVAPYRDLLAREDLEFLRNELAERLATDEHAARLLRRAAPRHVEQSGEAFVGAAFEPDEAPEVRRASGVRSRRAGSGADE